MVGQAATTSAARRLTGLRLPEGWKVVRLLEHSPVATGGCFSCGYEVESDTGDRAFLKALDYSGAFRSPDPAQALNAMTAAYIFERDLLVRCRERGLDRVVGAVASGKVVLDDDPAAGLVEYLIFERADGDVRQQMSDLAAFDLRWRMLCLRHVATALKQLHGELIAHQDVKPSNVLLFDRDSKLADLGRAACKGLSPPHEALEVAGDPSYAPPELLYGFVSPEWSVRRLGCDSYLLGSMLVWFFTGLERRLWSLIDCMRLFAQPFGVVHTQRSCHTSGSPSVKSSSSSEETRFTLLRATWFVSLASFVSLTPLSVGTQRIVAGLGISFP